MKDIDDYLNEPPDPGWCEEHSSSKPCLACAADEADRALDARREHDGTR
jgi:hypothetical protein